MAVRLVLSCYLVASVVLTWRVWADPAGRAQFVVAHGGIWQDVYLFAWFMRYDAAAVAHGHLALVTTALNAPEGINVMWNNPFLLPGVVLAPLTWLAGPLASLAVVLTLGFAGSAASLLWVLRRWGAAIPAAALGGAVYGFSPALIDSAVGHYDLQFAVLPPLIIHAGLRIVTGRWYPVRGGVWLGVLIAAQVFTGEELLADTGLAVFAMVVTLALSQPRAVLKRVGGAAAGLATAAAISLLICGYPLWVQFHGRLTEHGSPWNVTLYTNHPFSFVVPPGYLVFHSQASAARAAQPVLGGEYLGYLGWPLLVVLAAAVIWFWRDRRVRVCAVAWAILESCSLGGGGAAFGAFRCPVALLPWHWLQHAPLLSLMIVDRFSILADGAAGAMLAFSLDRAWSAMPRAAMPRAAIARRGLPAAVAVLALLPLLPVPLQAAHVTPVPAGWRVAFARLALAQNAPVLVVPGGLAAMNWQAASGEPGSLIGGYCIAPNPTGRARQCKTGKNGTGRYLDALWLGTRDPGQPTRKTIRADLAFWQPAAVVAVTSSNSRLGRFLTRWLGQPAIRVGRVLAWRRNGPAMSHAGSRYQRG